MKAGHNNVYDVHCQHKQATLHTQDRSRQLRKDEKYNFDNRDYDSFRLWK